MYYFLGLEDALKLEIQGQHIAIPIIANAIKKHWKNPNPVKPLVMIFHGPTGTGKNFASTWIARAMFEEGESSDYYHFFNGRVDFPSNGFTHVLQVNKNFTKMNLTKSKFLFQKHISFFRTNSKMKCKKPWKLARIPSLYLTKWTIWPKVF